MTREMTLDMMQQPPVQWIGMAVGIAYYVLKIGMFSTARERNGYAGVHELASRTRVVCKPRVASRPVASEPPESFETNNTQTRLVPITY